MHAIRMDITMVVIAAAVMAAPTLTFVELVDALTVIAVMEKFHVIMVAATTISHVKMMTN